MKKNTFTVVTLSVLVLAVMIPMTFPGNDTRVEDQVAMQPDAPVTSYGSSTKNYTAGGNDDAIIMSVTDTNPDRINRAINISVNANGMRADNGGPVTNVDSIQLNITFPNGTIVDYSMIHSVAAPDNERYHLIWKTNTTMDNGTYEIRAYPNTPTQYTAINYDDNLTTIAVRNFAPQGFIEFNTTDIYRNQTLGFNLSVFDLETPFENLTWNLSLYKGGGIAIKEWGTGDDLNQTYFFNGTDDTLINEPYSFDLLIHDTSGGEFDQKIKTFNVLNHKPVVHSVTYNWTETLMRVSESMFFEMNVSDYEDDNSTLDGRIILQDISTLDNISESSWEFAWNLTSNLYQAELFLPSQALIREYGIIIEVYDSEGPSDEGTTTYIPPQNSTIKVGNNLPEVHGLKINGKPANGLHFQLGTNLDFSVNVSDVEGMSYVEVILTHQGAGLEDMSFLVLESSGYNFTVAANLLEKGTYIINVKAYDADGDVTSFSESNPPFTMEIDPNTSVVSSSVVLSIVSIVVGILIGGAISWQATKKRITDLKSDMLIKSSKSGGATEKKSGKKDKKYVELADTSKKQDAKEKGKDKAGENKSTDTSAKKVASKKNRKTKSRF
ncbi:MAG: hypothetical protein ACTSUE_03360 [Promethearchaeota archaeon]